MHSIASFLLVAALLTPPTLAGAHNELMLTHIKVLGTVMGGKAFPVADGR